MVPLPRRRVLEGIGSLTLATLAGCTSDGPEGGPTSTPTPDSTETPAVTPTPTPPEEESLVETDPTELDASPLRPDWENHLPGQYELSTPGLGPANMYIGSRRELFAIDRDDGEIDWVTDLRAMTRAITPVVTDDAVYATARNLMSNYIQESGVDELWEDEHSYATPTEGATVCALDPTTGEEHWFRRDLPISGSPALDGGLLYVGLADLDGSTGVAAIAPDDGAVEWELELDTAQLFSNPAFGDDGVYFTTAPSTGGNSWVVAVSRSGSFRWTHELEGEVINGLAVADGVAFVGTDEGVMYAIDERDHVVWERPISERPDNAITTTPVVHDGTVYVSATDRLHALDAETGEERWRGAYTDDAHSGLSIADGMVHVGGIEISSFTLDGSEATWRIDLPGSAGSFGAPLYDEEEDAIYTGACVKVEDFDWYDHTVYRLA